MNKFLRLLVILGLLGALYSLSWRLSEEFKNRFFSSSLDMEEIKLLASIEGLPIREVLKELKGSGADAVSVYAFTLDGLQREGKATVLTSADAVKAGWPDGAFDPYSTYVLIKDDELFGKVLLALSIALGRDRVSLKEIGGRVFLEVKKDLKSLNEIPIGFSKDEVDMLKEQGFKVYLRIKNFREVSPEYIRYLFDEMDALASDKVLIFEGNEVLGYPSFLDNVAHELKDRGYTMGLVEFAKQVGKESMALKSFPKVILVHSIDANEMLLYDEERATLRYLRAVKERNMRILYFRFFQNLSGNLVGSNVRYISEIIDLVKGSGFELGNPHLFPSYKVPLYASLMIALGTFSATLLLMVRFVLLREGYKIALLALSTLVYLFLYFYVSPYTANTLSALLASVTFPSLGMCMMLRGRMESFPGEGVLSYVRRFTVLILYPVSFSLIGGVYIGGLLGEPLFMLKLLQFRGVKLSYLLPLLISGIAAFYYENRRLKDFLKEPLSKEEFVVFLALTLAIGIYLVRSGNLPLIKPLSAEKEARDLLEFLLYARPRFKEFFVGYPAMALFIYLSSGGLLYRYRPLVFMVGAIAPISIINTFCHIHTPFLFSLLRSFNGFWLGWLMGFVLILALHFIYGYVVKRT